MDFSKLASLSIGLAAFLGGLWIVLQIVKSVKRNGNHPSPSKLSIGDLDHSKIAVLESEMLAAKDEIEKIRDRMHDLGNQLQVIITTLELLKRPKDKGYAE